MLLSDLLNEEEYRAKLKGSAISFRKIVFDTRRLSPDALFVVLPGRKNDPLFLLTKASCRPAAIVLPEGLRLPEELSGIPAIYVKNTHETLAFLYSRQYGSPEKRLKICGVTGTAGKSSTAEMLYRILRKKGLHTALIGSIHCLFDDREVSLPTRAESMTTPEADVLYPLLSELLALGAEYVVMEVSSQALALGRCAPIRFRLAIFTNLSPEHLDFHNNMEAYFEAKARLFQSTEASIIASGDPYGDRMKKTASGKVVSVGKERHDDYQAAEIRIDKETYYTLSEEGLCLPIRVPIPASFTVQNSLLAYAAARELGLYPLEIAEALSHICMISGRMEKMNLSEFDVPFSVLIDYAHTPIALETLLKTAREQAKGRILLVFGCGGDRDKSKRSVMGAIAEKYADLVFLTSDNSRNENGSAILEEIKSGMSEDFSPYVIPNREEAICRALDEAQKDDLILLVGKGHERYLIIGEELFPLDEREIVRKHLLLRKGAETE